jgi:hypothetical protein
VNKEGVDAALSLWLSLSTTNRQNQTGNAGYRANDGDDFKDHGPLLPPVAARGIYVFRDFTGPFPITTTPA